MCGPLGTSIGPVRGATHFRIGGDAVCVRAHPDEKKKSSRDASLEL